MGDLPPLPPLVMRLGLTIQGMAIYEIQKQPPEVFFQKRCSYKRFSKFTGKHLCQSLFSNKVAELRLAFLKRDSDTDFIL